MKKLLLTAFAVSSAVLSRVMPRGTDGKMLICIWLFFGLLNDVLFGFWAVRKLQTEFRLAATRRFERTPKMAPAVTPSAPMTAAGQPLEPPPLAHGPAAELVTVRSAGPRRR